MNPDYAEITPIDPENPFRNPTEEPDYSPDYRAILPEIDMPGSKISLIPSAHESAAIRRYFALTCLTLLFGLLTSMTIFVALQGIAGAVIRQVDLRRLGELPQNYTMILRQYISDSSIAYAINLIAFLCGNSIAFLIGCKLTGLHPKECFRLRGLTVPREISYIFIGLLIQLATGYLSSGLMQLFRRNGLPVYVPDIELSGSGMRIAMIALYSCIVAPVTEELLMRGFVLKNLSRVSQRLGIFVSAFLFAVMHENLMQFLFTFPLGILLGYITVKHNSLTPAILVHIAVNTAGVALSLCENYLVFSTYRIVDIAYTLGVLLLGGAALFVMVITEKLPSEMPHQSMRGGRVFFTAPLFWCFLLLHLFVGWFTTH